MLILVTERKAAHAELIARLQMKGIYAFVCSYETADRFCRVKDTGGMILDGLAELGNAEALCASLHAQYPEMPIAAILAPDAIPNMPVNRLIRATPGTDIFEDVLDFCTRLCGWCTQRLTTYSLSVGIRPEDTYYMGYALKLSPREFALLHCLFYRSPRLTSKEDLIELCYPYGRQGVGNVAVQIRAINRKAALIDPRPLIVNEYGRGYRLRDGII